MALIRLRTGTVPPVPVQPLWAPTSSIGATGYIAYGGCGGETLASHVCMVGEESGAFFESTEEVEYEVCVSSRT